MKTKDFNKLIQTKPLQKIIYMHCFEQINLTSYQLDRVIKLKRKKEAELWKNKSMII